MKKFLRFGAAGAVLAASMAMGSTAYAADTASATAKAEVLSALTLAVTPGTSLDFGGMVVPAGGGSASYDASSGTLNCTGVVCSGTTGLASFDITGGTANKAVTINFGATSVNLVGPAATDIIKLSNFNSNATLVTTPSSHYETTLSGTGTSTFLVGGDLTLAGTEAPGVYSGTFAVTVVYS